RLRAGGPRAVGRTPARRARAVATRAPPQDAAPLRHGRGLSLSRLYGIRNCLSLSSIRIDAALIFAKIPENPGMLTVPCLSPTVYSIQRRKGPKQCRQFSSATVTW